MDKLVKDLCVIKARINSSRLPGKVMLDLAGKTFLGRIHDTVLKSKSDYDKENVIPYMKINCNTSFVEIDEKYKEPNIIATIDALEDYIKMQNFCILCKKESIESNIDNFISITRKLK